MFDRYNTLTSEQLHYTTRHRTNTQDTGRIHTTLDEYTRHRANTHDTGRIHTTPDEYTRHQTNTQDTERIDKTTQHSKLKI
jgi:hypothetical protein